MNSLLFSDPLCLMALALNTQGVLIGLGITTLLIILYIAFGKNKKKEYKDQKMLKSTSMNKAMGMAAALAFVLIIMSWTTANRPLEIYDAVEDGGFVSVDPDIFIEIEKPVPPPPAPIEPPKLEPQKIKIDDKPEPKPDPEKKTSKSGTTDGKGEQKSTNKGPFKWEPPTPMDPPDTEYGAKQEEIPIDVANVMPRMCGCEDKVGDKEALKLCSDNLLRGYLSRNTNYPNLARELGYEGKVYVRFIVEKDGSIKKIEILKDATPGAGMAEAAKRAVEKMARNECWKPGEHMGKKARVRLVIPVVFKLRN